MKILKSSKFKLPRVYFINKKEEIRELPTGIPYIYGDEIIEEEIIRTLEYELLYTAAKKTKLPFNFKLTLRENGYDDLTDYWYSNPAYFNYGEEVEKAPEYNFVGEGMPITENPLFKEFIKDSSSFVDISTLKNLKIIPTWGMEFEKAVEENIHNYIMFNPFMYNKKREGFYGGVEYSSPLKNIIIADISGSIPKGVSSTILAYSKHLAEAMFADILITGTRSTLYEYERIHELDITRIYEENGMDNDQVYFKKLVENPRKYNTCICFGDNHHPGGRWNGYRYYSDEEGKKINQWEIKEVISFHTSNDRQLAGYARWFNPDKITHIRDWVKYLS